MNKYRKIPWPDTTEYPAYSQVYMDLLDKDDMILDHLYQSSFKIKNLIYSLPKEIFSYRYAGNKWTIKEILVHLIDDERIFTYRALRYARNDNTPLHGFEENKYAKYSNADQRSLDSIFDEYSAVRNSTIMLFQHLPEDSLMRRGSGIDFDGSIINPRTVRALAFHIAGHELHHIKIIKERYLKLPTEDGIL